MAEKMHSEKSNSGVSRRNFLTTGAVGVAAVTAGCVLGSRAHASPSGAAGATSRKLSLSAPFDTFRDYIMALEERGLLLRFEQLDQDAYEMTALMYRLIDDYGYEEAPAILAEQVKINGQWVKGPLVANHQGHLDTEAIVFGVEPIPGDARGTYRKAMAHLQGRLENGEYPQIEPIEVQRDQAMCKQVVLRGDEVDLSRFAFIQSNPSDGGRYINTGSVFTSDPKMGMNYGTYRCQLRGPRIIGVNPEPNQTGWKHLMEARKRGEKAAKAAIVLGQDPYVWVVSGSRVANRRRKGPIDELAIAGGLRGKALEVVRCEISDMLVPAHAELVIEGEIPLDQPGLPEGPFGEMCGYLGLKKKENFFMNVTTVTHRRDPWLLNVFTGATRGYVTGPTAVLYNTGFKRFIPQLIELHSPVHAPGITYIRIKKTAAGQGIDAGKVLASMIPIFKVVIVVDDDIDVLDPNQIDNALATRWQAGTASHIYKEARGLPLDPSSKVRGKTSKIVIDATRQWPEEGGPDVYPELNRTLLERGAPDALAQVDAKWGGLIKGYRCSR
ncbi:MAG: twin-arginine translocation signal domain-containing protein [Deltaproteobacteria bacterium]|jgi:4-hydroxy-3-polyprenylbenzoate decarboxylase|nr:UbiD family decarboxylase [Deltaproteobacteria bacterium]MBW2553134.1 UbiD family decarboxylase [Deltaproteobacteria bacterium]NOQ85688.1 twin-arginine translocation signal domain-containing protein [Deltaproteobacteria bacterium]